MCEIGIYFSLTRGAVRLNNLMKFSLVLALFSLARIHFHWPRAPGQLLRSHTVACIGIVLFSRIFSSCVIKMQVCPQISIDFLSKNNLGPFHLKGCELFGPIFNRAKYLPFKVKLFITCNTLPWTGTDSMGKPRPSCYFSPFNA